MTYRKKLIEVALPLDVINKESVRENYIYKGNPSAIHKWWAQRPLAACRAVLFASLVDDPSSRPDEFPTEEAQQRERDRLFDIIKELVVWENSNNEVVLAKAREEIAKCTDKNPPPFLDPFAGGGSIPLEAQRLGLETHASDLNPVSVLINKALIEMPPKFSAHAPVNPESRKKFGSSDNWKGAQGLAEDVRYYGKWMRDEATKRIGHLYPTVQLPKEHGGVTSPVIAWIWARTVRCPNPACGAEMPLVKSFVLSTKKGKQAWAAPVIDHDQKCVRFEVRHGEGTLPESTVSRRGARCLVCSQIANEKHIKMEAKTGHMGTRMMAMVTEGQRGRVYLSPNQEHETVVTQAQAEWIPETELAGNPRHMTPPLYGLTKHSDLFTSRQLAALATLNQLVIEARLLVYEQCQSIDLSATEAKDYADAIATYLAFACNKYASYGSALVPWYTKEDRPSWMWGRQAISIVWDFAEINPFAEIGGAFAKSVTIIADSLGALINTEPGFVSQADAAEKLVKAGALISTDPPYFDNVPYADLSDFFYVWLRYSLKSIYPELASTLLVPKTQELVADQHRHGGKEKAEEHFLTRIRRAFSLMRQNAHPDYPMTVYYAFKQAEAKDDAEGKDGKISVTASTGWETLLEGLIDANFQISGTWPMRTERSGRLRDTGSNALASSIVLVCRTRQDNALVATRREFMVELRRELPDALRKLQHGNIAPVDLAQAAIGPGMAVFSRYSKVIESDGKPMRVRTALQLINQSLDEVLAEQEGEYDNDTRWAIAWFESHGTNEGPYGTAETLSKAKNTSVNGLAESGVLQARAGKVKLLSRDQLDDNWNPTQDKRKSVWEITQHLIRALEKDGEYGAAGILAQLGSEAEAARDLAYRLYTTCERKKWADEALAYNSLVVAWPSIVEQKAALPGVVGQTRLDF